MFLVTNDVTYNLSIHGELPPSGLPPLVLLHGFTGSAENWHPLIIRLSQPNRAIITIDILGHGRSDAPLDPSRYQMERVAADIADLFTNHLAVEPVNLLGYSMGGRLALALAHDFPQLVNRLILESASPGLKTAAERAERKERDDYLAAWIDQQGIPAFVDRWEAVPLFDSQKMLPEEIRSRLRNQRLQNSAHGLANSLRGMGTGVQPSFWEDLGQLTMPVQLIVGKLDTKFCRIGQEMVARLPNATLAVVENAGHTVHLEQPKKFAELCNLFLKCEESSQEV